MTQTKPAVPLRPRTQVEYNATIKYFQQWKDDGKNETFAGFLLRQKKLAQSTRLKHLRQAQTLIRRGLVENAGQLGSLTPGIQKPPPNFSDDDFLKLYNAFADCRFPQFIQSEHQYRYWQCVIHFASITALRRQAILGLTIDNINFNELFVTIPPNIDKKNTERYKPITKELADEILALRRFYETKKIHPALRKKLFPWIHGSKCWYACWNAAEKIVGKRFRLHDLKRFSGILALRAGATPLELQQHLDHANLSTTLKHYCRPQTAQLVQRIKIPIPKSQRHKMQTPLFTEPELLSILHETIAAKLDELGVQNCDGFLLDHFGNPFLETRTTEETIPPDKKGEQNRRVTMNVTEKKGGKTC
ncbi:MAG: site-specific integrase [Planctomycetaceae bacterium]|nr:site-specific integrase [Planctomycetaceae bacterium]